MMYDYDMRACIYTRVSTTKRVGKAGDQNPESNFKQNPKVQEEPLRRLIEQRGWKLVKVYSDRASGAKDKRPALNQLINDARRGLFDAVVVFRFDRFARSTKQLATALGEFQALNIQFVSHQEAIDTSTPMGKCMFHVIAAVAELERDILAERVQAGMEYASRHGTRSGKAIGRPRRVFRRHEAIRLREQGLSWRRIAEKLDVPVMTVVDACTKTLHE
jgi:DNA invertase Pin-like site-specific DNA recombinase